MLITDRFILLNLPKTASTFARQAVKKAFDEYKFTYTDKLLFYFGFKEKKVNEVLFPNIKVSYRSGKDQHGTYDQIPTPYKKSDREIVSIIRNPFDAYVSRYTFESWKRNAPKNLHHVKERFPHFPDLSFAEYVEYCNRDHSYRLQGVKLKEGVRLGMLSIQFIQMFCKNHKKVLANIDKDYKKSGLYVDNFPRISFLRMENINEELYNYLLDKGFDEEKIDFIRSKKKVNVSNKRSYKDYLDKETAQKIYEEEWLLFDLFPDYCFS